MSPDAGAQWSNTQDFDSIGERAVKGRSSVGIDDCWESRAQAYEGERT